MTVAQTKALIDTVVGVHQAMKRDPACELIVWLQAQASRADTVEVRKEMMARPEWTALHSMEALYAIADQPSTPARTATLQLYADHAVTEEYRDQTGALTTNVHRAMLERLLAKKGEALPPSVWERLLPWFRTNHPNPKLFFAQPHVLAKAPASLDFSDLPTPARPRFADEPLKGGRAGA
jgi:hypothetical protein